MRLFAWPQAGDAPRIAHEEAPVTGINRLFFPTLLALACALPACSTRGVPRPIPERALVRVPATGLATGSPLAPKAAVSRIPRHNDPLANSTVLEESGGIRMLDGRAPVGPHFTPAFRTHAAAHECERYVHTLTARTNARRNLPPVHSPPVRRHPPVRAPQGIPTAVVGTAPVTGRVPASFRPSSTVTVPPRTTSVVTPWTAPPRPVVRTPVTSRPATPVVAPISFPVVSTPTEVVPPFSLSSVPSHLRNLNALQAQEERLADQSIAISMERRAVLRVATAIREHQTRNSASTRETLDDAFREYQQGGGGRLSLTSGANAFASAEPVVRSRLDAVNNERKAVTRLIVALSTYQQSPSNSNGLAVANAVEKYHQR